jgi:hypothetical protein
MQKGNLERDVGHRLMALCVEKRMAVAAAAAAAMEGVADGRREEASTSSGNSACYTKTILKKGLFRAIGCQPLPCSETRWELVKLRINSS